MALDSKLLRMLFAGGAVLAVLVAAGFYLRSVVTDRGRPFMIPQNIPTDVAEIAKEFKFSKSEGGRTLFTIRAASFQQYKEGQRFELHDASITLYGRDGSRSDHIYGSNFQYDKGTGQVTADGEVQIDIQANDPVTPMAKTDRPGPGNVIHLKTSGLTFNENTRVAQTSQRIEFRIPEANGSAVGATYDSLADTLALKSAVKVETTGRQKATITGDKASIVKSPQRIIVDGAKIDQSPRVVSTDKLTVFLRDDNTVDHILGDGNVHAARAGEKGFDVAAPTGELVLDKASQMRSGTLSGGVTFAGKSKDEDAPPQGKAGLLLLSFGQQGKLDKVRAEDSVEFRQGTPVKSQEMQAAAIDFYLREGKVVEKAVTSAGPAQIVQAQGATRSIISAGQFDARFDAQNRLREIFGSPDARILSVTPNKPDRTTSSHEVTARFDDKGEITSAEQAGSFHFQEDSREGWAERAQYNPADESYLLSGSPRLMGAGRELTADSIQLSRKTDSASAQGHIKSTYNRGSQRGVAPSPAADPIHITGATMTANHATGTARYTDARLWSGSDIIEAPVIIFDDVRRGLKAEKDQFRRVNAVFVQGDQSGKTTPVYITADDLSYTEAERKAVFHGNVLVRVEGSSITADTVQALLAAPAKQPSGQLDSIVAQGDIQVQQPQRRATGSQLVYTTQDEKFVLRGSATRLPSIFDAERGQILGDSLTFFRHDGRVLVGSGEAPHIQPETKVQDASKK
jgi:lipopolysaccharide export system protein LptA